jgi:hypothetical protein
LEYCRCSIRHDDRPGYQNLLRYRWHLLCQPGAGQRLHGAYHHPQARRLCDPGRDQQRQRGPPLQGHPLEHCVVPRPLRPRRGYFRRERCFSLRHYELAAVSSGREQTDAGFLQIGRIGYVKYLLLSLSARRRSTFSTHTYTPAIHPPTAATPPITCHTSTNVRIHASLPVSGWT